MPIISAYADHPTRPYVRVEINWSDVPAASYAGVYRVDVATGECTPLRPYICYSGWELLLSCGSGTFWDTEAPFDTPFYYVTTSSEAPCIPAAATVADTFTRTELTDWGEADTGQTWIQTLPAGATASVSGGRGRVTVDTADETVTESIPLTLVNYAGAIQFFTTEVATGSLLVCEMHLRFQDASNYYFINVLPHTTGEIIGRVGSVVGGVVTFDQVTSGTYTIDMAINTEWEISGSTIRLKWWSDDQPDPSDWLIERTEASITTAGDFQIEMGTSAGNTNIPVELYADNLSITELCAPCVPVTADTSTTPITIANDGGFWLKDPVRPCNDQPVPLCSTGAATIPGCGAEGILFVGIGPEVYASNSFSLRPMNRRRTIAVTRPRGDATTALRLQTLTFTDRDELLDLVIPGTPLLFQGPSEYGIPDRYMDIQDVQVSPELSDLRIQIRSETLPYNTVDRPAGSTQGICGAQVADICRLYPTWNDLAATGFTWNDLVRGAADPAIANPLRRTWDDVEAEFVDWDAVEAGGRTWTDLLVGD